MRWGCPEGLFHADNLTLVRESLEGLKGKLETRKRPLKTMGLKVNAKTEMIISSHKAKKVVEEVWAVIPSSTSFANVGGIGHVVASEADQSRIISVNVRLSANLETHTAEEHPGVDLNSQFLEPVEKWELMVGWMCHVRPEDWISFVELKTDCDWIP